MRAVYCVPRLHALGVSHRAQGRWARHEEEVEKDASCAQVLSMEQGKASKRQIFSSKEAFSMLANELLGFIRRQYTGLMDVSADSVGDDVYTWSVEMWKSAFKPDCQLAKVRPTRSTKDADGGGHNSQMVEDKTRSSG
eukprot:GHRQ01026259.1.p2 GENE.GHRQ01026259.1~~GHRQ01026259.1.p2  ORF type:complete len:138 (+),score=52.31 GHRQ01026259.1:829-1242(+)